MSHCAACGKDTAPFGDFVMGVGVVSRCGNPECGAPIPAAAPAVNHSNGAALQVVEVTKPRPVPPPVPLAPSPVADARATGTLIAEMRARRAAVAARLQEMRALSDELALLDLMLAAVDVSTAPSN